MSKERSAADEYAKAQEGGPCLVPNTGVDMPSCHENDFCACNRAMEVMMEDRIAWHALYLGLGPKPT